MLEAFKVPPSFPSCFENPEPVAKQVGDAANSIVGDLSRLKRSHEQRRNEVEGEKEDALEDGLADLLDVFI